MYYLYTKKLDSATWRQNATIEGVEVSKVGNVSFNLKSIDKNLPFIFLEKEKVNVSNICPGAKTINQIDFWTIGRCN